MDAVASLHFGFGGGIISVLLGCCFLGCFELLGKTSNLVILLFNLLASLFDEVLKVGSLCLVGLFDIVV